MVESFTATLAKGLKKDPPKRKGERTRERFKLATAQVLEDVGFHAMRVSDITSTLKAVANGAGQLVPQLLGSASTAETNTDNGKKEDANRCATPELLDFLGKQGIPLEVFLFARSIERHVTSPCPVT